MAEQLSVRTLDGGIGKGGARRTVYVVDDHAAKRSVAMVIVHPTQIYTGESDPHSLMPGFWDIDRRMNYYDERQIEKAAIDYYVEEYL